MKTIKCGKFCGIPQSVVKHFTAKRGNDYIYITTLLPHRRIYTDYQIHAFLLNMCTTAEFNTNSNMNFNKNFI